MIYGRGTVWVICQERYDPKFFTAESNQDKWKTDIRKSRFYNKKSTANGILSNMKNNPARFGLITEELKYTSIIELELVQHWPDTHTEDELI
jgi:hypothetical protein